MLKFLLSLCALSIGLCYATPSCHELQKSQLASLNERITQMLSTLYTSPKAQPPTTTSETASNATPAEEYISAPYEASFYNYHPAYAVPAPQVIYVSPPHATPYPFYPPPPKPSVVTPPPAPTPYYHLEAAGQPLDPYRGVAAVASKSPISHYYDHYQYPAAAAVQYPPPPPPAYAPTPYPAHPVSYPYSWDYSTPYPEYPVVPPYSPKPVYAAPVPAPPPSYQPPPAYLPPISYLPPPYYPKQHDLQPPPYYA